MLWWLGGILLTLGAMQLVAVKLMRRHDGFDRAAAAVNALSTAAAILFAGYWYIYERKGQPEADTTLRVIGLKVSKDYVALQARFSVKNLGSTLLKVGQTDARLMEMDDDSLPLQRIAHLPAEAFPATMDGRVLFDDGSLGWPTIRWFHGGGERRVEPGETDLRLIDFVASCRNTAMRLYFGMQRPGTSDYWRDVATIGMTDLCSKPVGTKEELSDSSK